MSLPPIEIPLGAMRFNSDSQKLEYWNGSAWFQIHTFSPNLGGNGNTSTSPTGNSADYLAGARGLFGSRYDTAYRDRVDYINISSQGDAVDFGDDINGFYGFAGGASNTRAIYAGGSRPGTGNSNEIRFATFATAGNFNDFGDLSTG